MHVCGHDCSKVRHAYLHYGFCVNEEVVCAPRVVVFSVDHVKLFGSGQSVSVNVRLKYGNLKFNKSSEKEVTWLM